MSPKRLFRVSGFALSAVSAALYAQGNAPDWNEVDLSEHTYREHDRTMRRDLIDIPLGPDGELEYKLGMQEGDAIVYSWRVEGIDDPELLYAEFHGHTEREPGQPGTLMFYRRAEGLSESGALTAPFSGIHGWYLQNRSERAIVVKLDVAGFYELVEQ
jgi:hypothetical protein